MRDQHDPRYLIAGYVSTLVGGHPEDSLSHADAILALLRDKYGTSDAHARFALGVILSPVPVLRWGPIIPVPTTAEDGNA